MDTKDVWLKVVDELAQLNRTFGKLLKAVSGPRKNDNPTDHDKQNAGEEDGNHDVSVPSAFSNLRPSPNATAKAKHKWYHPGYWWGRSLDWWKVRVEFIAFFFAIAYAIITYGQWHDANANFRQDQRAWLAPGDYVFEFPEQGWIRQTLKITNTGKTPALLVSTRTNSDTFVTGQTVDYGHMTYPTRIVDVGWGTIFPAQKSPATSPITMMDDFAKRQDLRQSVAVGKTIQRFYGEITYKDIFGKKHWTHFCVQATGNLQNIEPCPMYNDTDDYPDKDDARKME